MTLIPDPNRSGLSAYEVLGLDPSASRREITRTYALARRQRTEDSRTLASAHDQLGRLSSRLKVDLMFYNVPDPEPQAEVDLASLSLPLPPLPIAALVDLDEMLEHMLADDPPDAGAPAALTAMLPLRFGTRP